jgi:hypothetical protein
VAGATGGRATRINSRAGFESKSGFDMDDEEDIGDDASSHDAQPAHKDALNITAQSVRLQLDLLGQVSSSLSAERKRNPTLQIADPSAVQALGAYESAVGNLKGLVGDLLRIANDREAYWQYRLDREANIRKMWEESMAKVAKDQEVLENRIGEVEVKRKKTKRALRDALENLNAAEGSRPVTPLGEETKAIVIPPKSNKAEPDMPPPLSSPRRKSTYVELAADLSDNDSDNEEEFFDAVGAGEVEVVDMPAAVDTKGPKVLKSVENSREGKTAEIEPSFRGYEEPVRDRLKLDADNRPKISLWVRLPPDTQSIC